MLKEIYTPTSARQHLFELIKEVNAERKPITIEPTKIDEKGAVLIGKDDWDAIKETLFLASTGVTDQVKSRENDDSEDFDDVWKNL